MPRAGTRSSGPPGSFDPEDLEHPVEAGPSGQATSEPASTKSNHKDKGKAPVVNEPTDDVNLRIQALAAANDELRARLDSYDRRSMDTLFRSVEDDRGAHHSVFPPAVHFAPAPALPRGVADHPRQEATSRSVSPLRGGPRTEPSSREAPRREDSTLTASMAPVRENSTFTGPMDNYPVSAEEDERLALQFTRRHQNLSKLFKNSGMSVSKIAPLAGRGNYKEWSIDMTQFFTAKFMRELLTGKAGNLPEEHEDFAYLETLKTIGAQTIKESVSAKIGSTLSTFQQPPQPEKMWSALASEYGTDNVFYVQKYVNQWRKLSRAKYSDPHELVNMHKKCIDEVSFIKTKCGLSPERAEEVGSIKLVRVTVLRT